MTNSRFPKASTLALALTCSVGSAWAVSPPPTVPDGRFANTGHDAAGRPAHALVTMFTPLAGSERNAESLIGGLRSGSTVVLQAPAGATHVESATFTPPTQPMGFGNIRIALLLAKAELAKQGITHPTPTQLEGALMGTTTIVHGTTIRTPGVLALRASGMGWGRVAHAYGFKLGPIVSGHQSYAGTGGMHGRHSGITTAGSGAWSGHETRHSEHHGASIATAGGGPSIGHETRHAGHHGGSIATATGGAVSGGTTVQRGIASAAGGSTTGTAVRTGPADARPAIATAGGSAAGQVALASGRASVSGVASGAVSAGGVGAGGQGAIHDRVGGRP